MHVANCQRKTEFAIGIIPGANSSILSFAIVTRNGETFTGTQLITEQQFMYFILGYWPCRANPQKEDLMQKNEVPNIALSYDRYGKVNGYYNPPIHELWKIKYPEHPIRRDLGPGWGLGKYNPSPRQAEFLYKQYGVLHVNTHYFVGEKLFQILKDIQDPEWINNYQNLPEN